MAGARPNFIKIAPLINELEKVKQFNVTLIHTGQHYDSTMSDIFFKELNIKKPDVSIISGAGSHAEQTAKIMTGLEKEFTRRRPGLVIVVGDVNSTLSAAMVTSKMVIPLAHVEAGLRSYDMAMPEEVNRIVTDRLSKYLFTPSADANKNLAKEGIDKRKIFFTGNIMIDTLKKFIKNSKPELILKKYGLKRKEFCLLTLHRPSNVDNKAVLERLAKAINEISNTVKVIFPVHPRTAQKIRDFDLEKYFTAPGIMMTEPIGYIETIALTSSSKLVITDSGGLQEESTYLKVPCLTLRENTERPVTETEGTNTIIGTDTVLLLRKFKLVMSGKYKKGRLPKYWDGNTAKRITRILEKKLVRG
ncbi:MAG: UDP-N-acetylglucosamine 2-epimerase (non-hydrolyzing) [Ignavibacteria bacterium]